MLCNYIFQQLIKDAESEESETRRSLQPKDSFLAQLRGLDTEINIITVSNFNIMYRII